MFVAPRFIAIDDNAVHLQAIGRTLQSLGTSCFGIHYDVSTELRSADFQGVRCIFMDLHLTTGIPSTDEKTHYGIIAGILDQNISSAGGPFILIVWTEYAHLCDGLRQYLETSLIGDRAHACPLAVLGLSKPKFINVSNGTELAPQTLEAEVTRLVESIPQLAAILDWEQDVLKAAGETLASLLSLVDPGKRTATLYPAELDTILSRLACEAVGKMHVASDPKGAITKSLSPILADRVLNQKSAGVGKFWPLAVTKHGENGAVAAKPDEAGLVNKMLHVALPDIEKVAPSDWGAVVHWPVHWPETDAVPLIGLTVKEILAGEMKITEVEISRCKPMLIRIGAACDYAQSRPGPIPYLLAVIVPEGAQSKKTASQAVWKSPILTIPAIDTPFRLYVHVRYAQNVLEAATVDWNVVFRLREQLLMQLISEVANYSARPGIVKL